MENNIKSLHDYRLKKEGLVMDNIFLEIIFNCNNSNNIENEKVENLNKLFDEMIISMEKSDMSTDFISLLELYLQYSFYHTEGQRLLFIKNIECNSIDIYDPINSIFLGCIEPFMSIEDDTKSGIVLKVSSFKRIRLTFNNQTDVKNKIITMTTALYSILTQSKSFMDCIVNIVSIISSNENVEIEI